MASSPSRAHRRPWLVTLVLTLALTACRGDDPAGPDRSPLTADALDPSCSVRTNSNLSKLLPCVTLEGVRAHQAALQAIADANGGTRAAGTPGAAASVAYVVSVMEAAGYLVTQQSFDFAYRAAPTLQQIAPFSATYATGTYTGSGSGSVTAAVAAVDLQLGLGNTSTSGCDAADFAGFPAGAIALIQRGFCNFSVKASNAQAAGAVAVIIFNQGNSATADRQGLIVGTLNPFAAGIPVVGASYADGVSLTAPGSTATVIVPAPVNVPQVNVLADSRSGDPDNVVVVGGHLDSVLQGPGIQDNGSGTAAILETAVQMARVKPRNQVRFAFWAAEEPGLIGSWDYLNRLTWEERDRIALYLNFDMIGSPNHVFFIYDGDDSDGVGAGPGPFGSAAIEKVFEAFYAERGLPFKGTDFSGRSDYGPFIAYGIPAGGLLTGAEGIKSPAEAALWGGVAGSPYDPCYHLACDTYDNVNLSALETNADAVAYATLSFAQSTASVNGNAGKGNFRPRTTPSARTAQEALPSN